MVLVFFLEGRLFRTRYHPLRDNAVFKISISLLILSFFLGMNSYHASTPLSKSNHVYHLLNNSEVVLIGMVESDPRESTRYTSATIACEEALVDGVSYPVQGDIRITLPQGFLLQYGDLVKIQGDLKSTIPSGYYPHVSRDGQTRHFVKMDYPDIEILSSFQGNPIRAALYRLRERANRLIFNMIPFPESAVLSGIMLGLDTAIPEYLWNGYRASGTAHIIVISGFNISIIAISLSKILNKKFQPVISLPITLIVIVLYTILVGADTPVVRAAVMAAIGLPAASIGRKPVGIHSLMIAAAGMLIFNPFQLWNISFQLSFLATLALLVMADPISQFILNRVSNKKLEKPAFLETFLNLLIPTLCASFVVFPILFKITGTLSVVSIPANLIVAPLQPLIMILGGLSILVGIISPWIGRIFGVLTWPLVALCNQVALRLSVHPSATKYLPAWIYPLSLVVVITVLVSFSIHQMVALSKPQFRNDEPDAK